MKHILALLPLLCSCAALRSDSGEIESPLILTVDVVGFDGGDAWAMVKTDVLDQVIVMGEARVVIRARLRGSSTPLWTHSLRAGPTDWWIIDDGESHHYPLAERPLPADARELYSDADIAELEARGFHVRFEP